MHSVPFAWLWMGLTWLVPLLVVQPADVLPSSSAGRSGWCQLSIKTLTLAGYCGAGHLAPSWFLWLPADSSSTIRSSRPVPSNSDSAGWKRKRSMHNTNVCFCSCELALKLRDDSIIESIVVPSLSTEVVKTPWTKPPQATLLLNLYCARTLCMSATAHAHADTG